MERSKKVGPNRIKVLVVDDKPAMLDFFSCLFKNRNDISVALNGGDALNLAKNSKYTIALVDARIVKKDFFDKLRGISPSTIPVVMSSEQVEHCIKAACDLSKNGFVQKFSALGGEILSIKDAAKILDLNDITVYRMVKRKELPAIRIGKQWKISRERLSCWLKDKESR